MKIVINKSELEFLKNLLDKCELNSLNRNDRNIVSGLKGKLKNDIPQLFIDGAADLHSKRAGIGGVFLNHDEEIFSFSENIGPATNNEAEYRALIQGLKLALKNELFSLQIFADSELVVKQINGEYKVKNERMKILHGKAKSLLVKFDSWEINHVRREMNKIADNYAKKGMLK